MSKTLTILISLVVVAFLLMYIVPNINLQDENKLNIKYLDSEGEIIEEHNINLQLEGTELQAIEGIENRLPIIPANTAVVEYTIQLKNTGNTPIDIAVLDAKIAGSFIR